MSSGSLIQNDSEKAGHIVRQVFFGEIAEGRRRPKKPLRILRFDKFWFTICEEPPYATGVRRRA